ncbi:MAG TPA: CCA tRNA nucleotidyltransferase [Phycisphaerae bacterium]|nr:CCA tRNA nucleotidyltransferase [Phycisphaerae bacterium]
MSHTFDAISSAEFEAAKSIIVTLKDHGHQALLAGGCVRDRLLGKTPKDYDVATSATPDEVCKVFKRTKKVGAQFGVVLVSHRRHEIEVATFRTDGVYRDGRRPEDVIFTDAEHDAQRRDFTINGMFYDPVEDKLVDYVGGQADLSAELIRCIGEPSKRFAEDHLRLLRAARFAATLNFGIEPETFNAMLKYAKQVASVSPERIRAELALMLVSEGRCIAWKALCETGLCNHIIQGVQWTIDDQNNARDILGRLPARVSFPLGLAAVFSPLAAERSPDTRKVCRAIRCSNEEMESVCLLLKWVYRVVDDGELELADIKNMLASGHFDEIISLATAFTADEYGLRIQALRERGDKIPVQDHAPPPLLDGAFLLEQHIPQGPIYRKVLDAVYRAQLNELVTTVDDARAMAQKLIEESD